MSITGELRRMMDTLGWYDKNGNIVCTTSGIPASDVACLAINSKTFGELCDRIDAEHERELRETGEEIVRDVRREWVRLPLDADGVPIHIGDVMENIVCPSVHREVTGVGVECFYGWDDGNGRYSQFDANCYRHHHEPTVEDVLREFAQEMSENMGMYTGEAIDADEWRDADARTVEKYAARLELREVGA